MSKITILSTPPPLPARSGDKANREYLEAAQSLRPGQHFEWVDAGRGTLRTVGAWARRGLPIYGYRTTDGRVIVRHKDDAPGQPSAPPSPGRLDAAVARATPRSSPAAPAGKDEREILRALVKAILPLTAAELGKAMGRAFAPANHLSALVQAQYVSREKDAGRGGREVFALTPKGKAAAAAIGEGDE